MNAIIALNPTQMAEAQTTTIGWAEAKLADAKNDLSVAETTYNSLHRNGLRTQPASTMIRKANRRILFYKKVKAALDAGYYVIPPFDIQIFAIRTDRASADHTSTSNWSSTQVGRSLPVGEGNFVDPIVTRSIVDKQIEKTSDGTTREVQVYRDDNFKDDLGLPVRAMKPTIIDAVGKALQEKIFDALGIAPAYRAADPIIAGHIRRPDGKGVLTFFVAWWLDKSDL